MIHLSMVNSFFSLALLSVLWTLVLYSTNARQDCRQREAEGNTEPESESGPEIKRKIPRLSFIFLHSVALL